MAGGRGVGVRGVGGPSLAPPAGKFQGFRSLTVQVQGSNQEGAALL